MKTIFHFNCVICGAQPGEKKIEEFDWPPSPDRKKHLLSALQWIFTQIINVPRRNFKFRQSITAIQEAIPTEYIATPLHDFEYLATIFTQGCPLCGAPPGERPYSRYFHAWSAWNLVCGVQVGNLLYEMWFLFRKIHDLSHLVPMLNIAIDTLDMQRCKCGRPTTMLSDGLCRWCCDAETATTHGILLEIHALEIPDEEDNEDDEETSLDIADTTQKILCFLEALKDNDPLGAGKEEWEAIRLALIRKIKESKYEGLSSLNIALTCHPVSQWLEPWRSLLYKEQCWPTEWNEDILKNPPAVPQGMERAWHSYRDLPLEVIKSLDTRRIEDIPPKIEEILYKRGLSVRGTQDDISGYLRRFSFARVREISNRLGAGKGRSKEEVIEKIIHNISPEQFTAAVPEIREPWVKAIRRPFEDLPEEWVRYTACTAPLIENFLREKFHSLLTLQKYSGEDIRYYIEINSECPSYCKEQAEKASLDVATSLERVPPWFPGCGCTVGIAGASDKDELGLKDVTVGNLIELEESDLFEDNEFKSGKFANVKPFGLHGQLSHSPNGHYSLVYSDWVNRRHGWYLLIERKQVIAFGRISQPGDGEVANNGVFILTDYASERRATFYVINRNGEIK